MRTTLRLALVGFLAGCLDTTIPPAIGAGTITGRVLVAMPGDSVGRPAAGAVVSLVESGLSVTTREDGRFELTPILTRTGTLKLTSGSLSRVMSLESLNAGPHKVTVLGDVALSVNASVQGEVSLADDPNLEGILAFVEGEASSSYSNRSGQFLLRDLPTGTVSLALYRQGYVPAVLRLELRGGERFVVDQVVLQRQTLTAAQVSGEALLAEQESSGGIEVTTDVSPPSATTSTSGGFALEGVTPGVRSFIFAREGYQTVTLSNRVIGVPSVVLPTVVLVPGANRPPMPFQTFPPYDAGTLDAGTLDAGTLDAGTLDAGTLDAGTLDAGTLDAGTLDAGTLDAGTLDAGTLDAGTLDAGTLDAGTLDAGTLDAGTPDAGTPDAGTPDAGTPDAGEPDAGTDAGPDLTPIAIIEPLPVRALQDAGALSLNGSNSIGMPGIGLYSWSVDAGTARLRDGGVVRPSVNNAVTAGVPSLDLPVAPAIVSVSLQVTDLVGRVSVPAATAFIVGDRPLALFDAGSLPSVLYSGESAIIDATPSRDTVGSNIASRRWVTSPNTNVTTTALANDQQLRINVGSITFGQQLTVSHYVTNGLGFESLERLHTITLQPGTLPSSPWSVSAGGTFTVDGGTVVSLSARLDAGSMVAAYADPSNYDWSWTALTDAGSPPQWAITNPSVPSTTFIPPVVEGFPVRYDFMVTATPRVPLEPGAKSATTIVLAQDRVRPQLFDYSVAQGVGSSMGTLLTFSEEMTQAFLNIDAARMPANVSVVNGRIYRDKQLMLVTRPPAAINDLWEFRITPSTVSDLIGNTLIPLDGNAQFRLSFLPELRWTPLFQLATSESTIEPTPALVLSTSAVLGQHSGVLLARTGSNAVAVETGLFHQCQTPPCAGTPQTFATGLPAGANDAGTLFFQDKKPWFQPSGGFAASPDGGTLPVAPGLVFSNGTRLSTAYLSGTTLRIAELDGGAWDLGNSTLAFTSTTFDSAAYVAGVSVNDTGSSLVTCVAVMSGTRVVPLTRLGAGIFGVPLSNNPAASGLILSQTRVGSTNGTCYFAFLQTDGKLVFTNRLAGDHGSTGNLQNLIGGGVSAVDVLADQFKAITTTFWIASIESGQLYLSHSTGVGSTRVAGPTGASLNVNPACVASRPLLSQAEQAIYVTWQEQCAGQPFTVYVRGLY